MFLFEKYTPRTFLNFTFNRDILYQLMYIATYEDIPHIIISGPKGSGKKTMVKYFLETLFDENVNILSKRKYNIVGSSSKKEIKIYQSNYHIIIEPTNTNHDKYILQEIIKQYAMFKSFNFKANRTFKVILIYNIENLAINTQAALRRTMELYAKTCRFIMICNNLSKIFDPLKSRCTIFCVPLPKKSDISFLINYISIMENIKFNNDDLKYILDNCENNLKKAMWLLDTKRLECNNKIKLDIVFENIIDIILNLNKDKDIITILDKQIRVHIYNILITNIKGSEIICVLMDHLIKNIKDDSINLKIIEYASEAEYNLIHGRRDIISIDYFIISVIRELIK